MEQQSNNMQPVQKQQTNAVDKAPKQPSAINKVSSAGKENYNPNTGKYMQQNTQQPVQQQPKQGGFLKGLQKGFGLKDTEVMSRKDKINYINENQNSKTESGLFNGKKTWRENNKHLPKDQRQSYDNFINDYYENVKKMNEESQAKLGYGKDGYNEDDFNKYGIHRNGTKFNDDGFDFEGYDKNGRNKDGYDRDGFNEKGFNMNHTHRNGTKFNDDGFDEKGKTSEDNFRDYVNGLYEKSNGSTNIEIGRRELDQFTDDQIRELKDNMWDDLSEKSKAIVDNKLLIMDWLKKQGYSN